MTLRKNWQMIYALSLVLVVGKVWAEEKKAISKPATAPECCSKCSSSACTRCCTEPSKQASAACPGELCDQCKAPSSSKLVTRIHPLEAFFEAGECMEEQETPMLTRGVDLSSTGVRKCSLEDQLMKLITNHIKPQSWTQVGGDGTIDFFSLGKALVITAKPETQEEIAKFLNELRSLTGAGNEEEEMAAHCLPVPFAFMKIMTPLPPAFARAPMSLPATAINPHCMMAVQPYAGPTPPSYYPPAPPTPTAVAQALADYSPRRSNAEMLPPPRLAMDSEAPMLQCIAGQSPSSPASACVVRAKFKDGKTLLEMENCCMAMLATCESMELKTIGTGSLKLTVQQNQIHIDGRSFRATADSFRCNSGSEWTLEGHVQLSYKQDGATAQVRSDRVVLNIKSGQVEFKLGSAPLPPSPVIQPAMHIGAPN